MRDREKALAASRRWRAKNPDKQRAACVRWNEANPSYHRDRYPEVKEKRQAQTNKWRAADPEGYRASNMKSWLKRKEKFPDIHRRIALKTKYGLTPEDVVAMLNSQERLCALCGTDDPGKHPGWVVDHCHRTKKVRGILCSPCNISLRKGRDTIEHLEKALAYIKRTLPLE